MEHVAEDENDAVNKRDVVGSSCGSDNSTGLEDLRGKPEDSKQNETELLLTF